MNHIKSALFLCFVFFFQFIGKAQSLNDTIDCPRSLPSPVLAERKCKTWSFKKLEKEGIEYAKLLNGDSVQIVHKGCKFYELGISYFFKYPKLGPYSLKDWSAKLIEALEQLRISGLNTINLVKYQEVLTEEIDNVGYLEDGKSFSAEDFVVKEKIFLEERGQQEEYSFYKFSISIGPL